MTYSVYIKEWKANTHIPIACFEKQTISIMEAPHAFLLISVFAFKIIFRDFGRLSCGHVSVCREGSATSTKCHGRLRLRDVFLPWPPSHGGDFMLVSSCWPWASPEHAHLPQTCNLICLNPLVEQTALGWKRRPKILRAPGNRAQSHREEATYWGFPGSLKYN